MTIRDFQNLNSARSKAVFAITENWTIDQHITAMVEELGEFAGIVKRINRGETTVELKIHDLSKELADLITYAFKTYSCLGLDAEYSLLSKFKEVSERKGWNPENDLG